MLDHEELYRRIKERLYEPNVPFSEGTTPEEKKKCRRRYQVTASEGIKQFRADLEECLGTATWASAPKIWEQAWMDGHSYGFHEVYSHYKDLVEVVRPCHDRGVVLAAKVRGVVALVGAKSEARRLLSAALEECNL